MEGTYFTCTKCKMVDNCCCSFGCINAPTLNIHEVKEISKEYSSFYDLIDNNIYNLKIVNDRCIFFVNGKCQIYDIRPLDCKLYPFDIVKKDGKYWLILYKLECLDVNEFRENALDIDDLVNKIKPWIDDFTNEVNFTKMKNKEYIILKEIEV